MDSVAPYKVMGTKSPSDPWLNDTTRALRRRCRQAECKWKKDRLQVSLEMFRDSLSNYQKAVKDAKGQYLSNLINRNSHRPGILFSTINSVINPVSVGLNDVSELTCNAFKQYFLDKVLSVRQAIILAPAVVTPSQAAQCVLENFETVTLMDLKKAVHELKATICPLDAVPARIMKEAIDIVGPCLVSFINRCLSLGTVPTALKHAIVRPLLKKSNLDPSIFSNFRPISHLPFLSKLMEKLVVSQLQSHLQLYAIADKFQSDDLQIYLPVVLSNRSALDPLHNCIRDIRQWHSQNFLHLNEGKTEYILFTPDSPNISLSFGPLTPHFAPAVCNLGVIFDSGMIFGKQISAVMKASFYQLRLLGKVWPRRFKTELAESRLGPWATFGPGT
ncbi:hypothetical protein QQF64_012049 [Cirrhinus molitorella]|uniref:Reverse transcriptase n=1 Tax=Cirrhinus molitorella TaxID=172907 RepID=A0ABR3LUF8_9TELE